LRARRFFFRNLHFSQKKKKMSDLVKEEQLRFAKHLGKEKMIEFMDKHDVMSLFVREEQLGFAKHLVVEKMIEFMDKHDVMSLFGEAVREEQLRFAKHLVSEKIIELVEEHDDIYLFGEAVRHIVSTKFALQEAKIPSSHYSPIHTVVPKKLRFCVNDDEALMKMKQLFKVNYNCDPEENDDSKVCKFQIPLFSGVHSSEFCIMVEVVNVSDANQFQYDFDVNRLFYAKFIDICFCNQPTCECDNFDNILLLAKTVTAIQEKKATLLPAVQDAKMARVKSLDMMKEGWSVCIQNEEFRWNPKSRLACDACNKIIEHDKISDVNSQKAYCAPCWIEFPILK
jgi:hypothetical protein